MRLRIIQANIKTALQIVNHLRNDEKIWKYSFSHSPKTSIVMPQPFYTTLTEAFQDWSLVEIDAVYFDPDPETGDFIMSGYYDGKWGYRLSA